MIAAVIPQQIALESENGVSSHVVVYKLATTRTAYHESFVYAHELFYNAKEQILKWETGTCCSKQIRGFEI